MAEVGRSDSPEGSALSSELSHSVVTSDDDYDEQPSPEELSSLCKESALPLNELLSLYGDHLQYTISCTCDSRTPVGAGSNLFETLSPSSSEDDNDEEYLPENDSSRHQSVPVGEAHQAVIPDLQRHYLPSGISCDEHLLWDPSKLPESTVEKYCMDVARHSGIHTADSKNVIKAHSVDKSRCIQDSEQALYLLLQCSYDVDEALRRHQLQVIPSTDPLSLWSDEERTNFIAGLKLYGKDFYLIQQNKVRTRSVGELVHVYYLWKKTDQYAAFTGKPYNFRRQTQQMPSVGSLEDVNRLVFHEKSTSPLTDWSIHASEMDSAYLEKYLPQVMPTWISSPACDAVLDSKSDAVYCRDIQCGMAYGPAMYMNCYEDQYHFPQCIECQCVNLSCSFGSSVTDSPNIGRGVSGELPAATKADWYFPESPPEDTGRYSLLTRTSSNMSNRNPGVHRCDASKMLAQ